MLELNENRLLKIIDEYNNINNSLFDPEVSSDPKKFAKLNIQRAKIEKAFQLCSEWIGNKKELSSLTDQLKVEKDRELVELLSSEKKSIIEQQNKLEPQIKFELLPKDSNSGKNIFVEIRAGTGGDEAALFARDLFRMYTRYLEKQKISIEVMRSQEIGLNGYKEIVFLAKGLQSYDKLHFEAGTHRVQRIPETESGGRLHTSACTVAIIPEVEEEELQINNSDLRFDVFRSSGPGGQSVNTTDSAVRITHIPTGLIVSCQDEKSQHKNKAKAMRVLRARLMEQQLAENQAEAAASKKAQIGSGDRSEKIRTYNFPQNRITDHRINYSGHNLDKVMDGELDAIIDALTGAERQMLLDGENE